MKPILCDNLVGMISQNILVHRLIDFFNYIQVQTRRTSRQEKNTFVFLPDKKNSKYFLRSDEEPQIQLKLSIMVLTISSWIRVRFKIFQLNNNRGDLRRSIDLKLTWWSRAWVAVVAQRIHNNSTVAYLCPNGP